jgi:hypothetical protein
MLKDKKTQKSIQIKPNMYKKHENLYITQRLTPTETDLLGIPT